MRGSRYLNFFHRGVRKVKTKNYQPFFQNLVVHVLPAQGDIFSNSLIFKGLFEKKVQVGFFKNVTQLMQQQVNSHSPEAGGYYQVKEKKECIPLAINEVLDFHFIRHWASLDFVN